VSGNYPQPVESPPPADYVVVDVPRSPGGSLISGLQEALDSSFDNIDRLLFGLSAAGLAALEESLESIDDKRDKSAL
jgi:hypothetical protein